MTINGPAPMLLGFFMNAAIDQGCEKYIRAEGQADAVETLKIDAIYAERGVPRPRYQGELPEGNDGLGLLLLGVTGDQVLDAETYAKIKADTLTRSRHGAGGHPQGGPGAEHLHLLHRVRAAHDGRHPGVLQSTTGCANFYSVSISGYHIAEAGANPDHAAGVYARQRIHVRRVLPLARA